MADGSVHFLKESIDIQVLARLVTRAGGEVVSAGEHRTRPSPDTTRRNGIPKLSPRGEAPMEVGAPASGIEIAPSANALTPRHEDLNLGTRARGPSLPRHS